MHTFVLLIYMTGGGLQVSIAPDFWSCIARSQFEFRFNPQVERITCRAHSGDEA